MSASEILRLRLRCDASAPRLARHAVSELQGIGPILEEALLVVSELTTNAVLHSGSESDEELELCARVLEDGLRIAVHDQGHSDTRPERVEGRAPGTGGLGLKVVEAIARRWGSEQRNGTTVWAELGFARRRCSTA